MIVPDANLLIYAADSQSAFHRRAHTWWTDALNSDEAVGRSWLVLLAFIRVMSSPRLMTYPARVDDLLEEVESWLGSSVVQVLQPSVRHPQALRSLLVPTGVGGNLVNDAHLAALAIENGAVLFSTDGDFSRFRGLRWVNPLR